VTPYAAYRLKLQSSFCPTANSVDKQSVACKSYDITTQMKGASDDQKKKLMVQKMDLYKVAATKSAEERKQAAAEANALYTRMYANFCTKQKKTTEPVCSNSLMQKMYGGPAKA